MESLLFRFVIQGVVVNVRVDEHGIRRWSSRRRTPLRRLQIRAYCENEAAALLRAQGAIPGERWEVDIGENVVARRIEEQGDEGSQHETA